MGKRQLGDLPYNRRMQKPTIGSSVHFNSVDNGKPKPQHAVIIDIKDPERGIVTLSITNWYGTTNAATDVAMGDTPGTWGWPPKV